MSVFILACLFSLSNFPIVTVGVRNVGLIGRSPIQIQPSPITSFWRWGQDEESDTYEPHYFFGDRPISHESVVDQFMSWAGVLTFKARSE